MSVCLSIRPHGKTLLPLDGFSPKIYIICFFFHETLTNKYNIEWNITRITGTLHENQYTYLISRSVLLRMRNVSEKVVQKIKKSTFYVQWLFFLNRAVYEIMWKNSVQAWRPQMTIWRMRATPWILKVTNTHSEYIILTAFPLQQWFCTNAPQSYVIRTLPILSPLQNVPLIIPRLSAKMYF